MFASLLLHSVLLSTHGVTAISTTTPAPYIEREEITVGFGTESFEQYQVAHVSAPWAVWPLVFVVPLGSGTAWYESTNVYYNSLAAIVAYVGIDLYIHEQRRGTMATLPPGSCPGPFGPGTIDCSAFGEWSVDDIVEDIAHTRDFLVSTSHKPSVGGHWTGAMGALAAVNAEPDEYASLILWEGTMYAEDALTIAKNASVCGVLQSFPDAAGASSAPGDEGFAVALAQSLGGEISPFPQVVLDSFFLTAGVATNTDVLNAIFIVDNFNLLDRVAEGLVFMVGTVAGGPTVADMGQVFNISNVVPGGTYAPLGVLEGYACGLGHGSFCVQHDEEETCAQAGCVWDENAENGNVCTDAEYRDKHTLDLDLFTGPVLAIASDRGMRTEMEHTVAQFTNASFIQTDYRGEFGVHDLLWSNLMKPVALEIALFTIGAHH